MGMTDEEVLFHLREDTHLNKVRKSFSSSCARIEQATQQRQALSPIDLRRMEFAAVEALAEEVYSALPLSDRMVQAAAEVLENACPGFSASRDVVASALAAALSTGKSTRG